MLAFDNEAKELFQEEAEDINIYFPDFILPENA